jgi:hypothetical protein
MGNAGDRVMLTLSAQPPTARFTVDGSPVEGNPYSGPYKKDGVTHQIRAEAPGYETAKASVVFDADVTRELTLKKRAGGAPPPVTKPSAADTGDAPIRKPNREIDTSFPGK